MLKRLINTLGLNIKIWLFRALVLLPFGAYPTTIGYSYVFMYRTYSGTAGDGYTNLEFDKKTKLIYAWTWAADMYIQVSYDGTNYDSPIEITADTEIPIKLPLAGLKARVTNKVSGESPRYQVIAWYSISKRR